MSAAMKKVFALPELGALSLFLSERISMYAKGQYAPTASCRYA